MTRHQSTRLTKSVDEVCKVGRVGVADNIDEVNEADNIYQVNQVDKIDMINEVNMFEINHVGKVEEFE